MELGAHRGQIHCEVYDNDWDGPVETMIHTATGQEPGWSFENIEEARRQAEQWLREPAWNKGAAIQAVTIHEPAEFGDFGGHLETHARNKVAADRARTEVLRSPFGGRSPGEVVYRAAGAEPKPVVDPGDRAGPVDRTGRFRPDSRDSRTEGPPEDCG